MFVVPIVQKLVCFGSCNLYQLIKAENHLFVVSENNKICYA